ncbi:hypothetical protein [Streptomyces sp. SJL17-1]|uniref:hypothetical protein n=1 Tax=Streptomyces sp. SJL17-1 TaxID=2967223 RepID=UPI0029671FAA|nr:hypothetical protein [Streptomyces sp. SJL17-1]
MALHGLADLATVDLLAEIADDAAAEPADGLTGDIVVRRLGKAPTQGSPAEQVLAPPACDSPPFGGRPVRAGHGTWRPLPGRPR